MDHNATRRLDYICAMPLRLLSILLISAMMYKPVLCTWAVVDFTMNRDYISAYLCENQNRPELECQGKCFLMAKLKKQMNDNEDHKAKQLTQLSKTELMDVISLPKFRFSNQGILTLKEIKDPDVCMGYLAVIFHPPIV